jgi:Transposase IS66 family
VVALHARAREQTVVGLERDEHGRRHLHDLGEPLAGGGPAGAQRLRRHRACRRVRGLQRPGPRRAALHPGALLGPCRRKFVEAEPHYPAPCGEALALIGQLYAVEQTAPLAGGMDDASRAEALRLRAMLRAEQSGPLVAELRAWAHRQRALPESSLGKAIAYMLGLWPGLTRFVEDPRIPLDNNATERGLRGMVVGRKNHYGSRSKRGTEVAALFYSLIESAKLCGVEPKAYLLQAVRAALANPGTVTLPHALLTN